MPLKPFHGYLASIVLSVPALSNCSTSTPRGTTSSSGGSVATGTGGSSASDASSIDYDAGEANVNWDLRGTIYSGVPWFDTSGKLVNAHGVGFIQVGKVYYMVGEQRSGANDTYSGSPINAEDTFTGVSMYKTTDFVNWDSVGTVVKPISGSILDAPYYGERPKILYNSSTGKYIIYIKMLNYTGSPLVYVGYYAVLTSNTIEGPYTFVGNLKQAGADVTGANDFQVFQDTDGQQYFVRDGGELDLLTADGLSLAKTLKLNVQAGEGVSLYKANGNYFWQSSQGSYWHSNDNSYSSASAISQLFVAHGTFCPRGTMTWQSQSTAVVGVQGSAGATYIYVGDRWVNGDLPASTLVVQPFTLSGDTESIPIYNPAWKLDVASGTWKAVTPEGLSINDAVTGTGVHHFNYTGDWASVSCSGCEGGALHSSASNGATASVAFTGTQILLYSAYDGSSGILGITVQDHLGTPLTPEVHVSLRYDAPPAGNSLVYASPVLASGSYLLKMRVTGQKDLYSNGTSCNVDRVMVLGAPSSDTDASTGEDAGPNGDASATSTGDSGSPN